ncbi:syntaxin-18 [Aphidius gifuensis]|uniref:syntaxin-18 n=1 Tax=Aphidius gifuensis TaxID=684658 RepID=UPI001CDD0FAD|nr:syntaxin-18 [Aphidius gifuensis]
MDVSSLFRASVKTISLRQKNLDTDVTKPILRKRRQESAFRKKTESLVNEISKLQSFLLENRSSYLNFAHHLAVKERIGDVERNQIDNQVQKIISSSLQTIDDLKNEISNVEFSQNFKHKKNIIYHIEEYLKNVSKIYTEQKAMRVKKEMELRKMSKFDLSNELSNNDFSRQKNLQTDIINDVNYKNKNSSTDSSPLNIQEINGDVNLLAYDEDLPPEDLQMLEAENKQLYNELNTLTEEVKIIENKVVHIAQLQEIFTENVLTQDRDLDRLMTTVVGATENVKDANEQIRQAIQRNASLRAFILFFIVVISFSLLFLDWYNP